ncbi:hypothetical protein BWQ96_01126 [Gracilariopsis chorda]|uniref:Uncharacterized protein n=1 Tax=Gracilariopsis chorda TaxID=448386 RepID=A0A2V3J3K3_9FLOR|nr:hypothetical protein BWQ96_01126 [Gracilariopsis chorda]|eukprot:PXF48988.1 hypothetical protein BWQ96_01126 [Gracilariopsis chorda]
MNCKNLILFLALLMVLLLLSLDAQETNVTGVFCKSQSSCVTYDGWQMWCPSQQPVQTEVVKVLKTFAVKDYYIVVQTMSLPKAVLCFAIIPDDSHLQNRPPNAIIPEDVDDISPSELRKNPLLTLLTRCFRIPPGDFKKYRWFPHGMQFELDCKAKSFLPRS